MFCISCNSKIWHAKHSKKDSTTATDKTNNLPENVSNKRTVALDRENIKDFFRKYPELNPVKIEVDSFYHHREYAAAWFDKRGLIEQAGNLYSHIQNLALEGLKDKLPYHAEFAAMMDEENSDSLNKDTEMLLTAQYFLYAKEVWSGLNARQLKQLEWYLPQKKLSYSLLLDSLIDGHDILTSPPIYRQYGLLKIQLKKYQAIKKAGGFPAIGEIKKKIKIGDTSSTVAAIEKWLFIAGDLPKSTGNNLYDDKLQAAIKKMQQRFGLKVDGLINKSLIKEMNVSLEDRMQQIVVNMERSRWVPVSESNDYLVINIPEFKLHAYENERLIWSMDAVVGKPANQTVVFSGKINYLVFSPYWDVPNSILQKEVLPGISRDKNYLEKQQMEWYNGKVRQRPGPDNALGLVKFLFPNNYFIYLHDTPSKYLFNETNRAFSHGCIRLSDAEKLANYLLKNDSAWTAAKIYTAMHLGKEKYVKVKKAETVFIVYFTAWVDTKGQLNFRKDLYERDKRLAEMLVEN